MRVYRLRNGTQMRAFFLQSHLCSLKLGEGMRLNVGLHTLLHAPYAVYACMTFTCLSFFLTFFYTNTSAHTHTHTLSLSLSVCLCLRKRPAKTQCRPRPIVTPSSEAFSNSWSLLAGSIGVRITIFCRLCLRVESSPYRESMRGRGT